MPEEYELAADVLVIGGGMAGLFAAIKSREMGGTVILVEKGYAGRSGATHFAGGDFLLFDSSSGQQLEVWLKQASRRSEYLNNHTWTEIIFRESEARFRDLLHFGVEPCKEDGNFRVGHAGPMEYVNLTYREYAPRLREAALRAGVRIIDRTVMCDLIKQEGRVVGAVGFNSTSGDLYSFAAGSIVIAAGGASLKEGNRPVHYATADGEAMAYRAGAEVSGKEFKFGGGGAPRDRKTAPHKSIPPSPGIDVWARFPSFRGGAVGPMVAPTLNAEGGEVTIPSWDAHLGLAPLYVDMDSYSAQQLESFRAHFSSLGTIESDKIGLNIFGGGKLKFSVGSIETAQSIHGGGSGIWPQDLDCASNLIGLYSAGDSCATMVSGAAYAGMGIGLCHAAVTGARAGAAAASFALKSRKTKISPTAWKRTRDVALAPVERQGGFDPRWATRLIQYITIPYFIFHVKKEDRLRAALTMIEFVNAQIIPLLKANDPHSWRLVQETRNMALHAEMTLRASIFRTESRGTHFREDYPRRDDPSWLAWVKIKEIDGCMTLSKEPVPEAWWPDLATPYEERYPLAFPGE
jgi:succinate dehydrogenase/fumarate reductase flavoprotein subunit